MGEIVGRDSRRITETVKHLAERPTVGESILDVRSEVVENSRTRRLRHARDLTIHRREITVHRNSSHVDHDPRSFISSSTSGPISRHTPANVVN